jgi:pyrroloquinoline quinone (PQQ) biosynthesis protein C
LRWEVEIRADKDAVVFERGENEYRFGGLPPRVLHRLASLMNGERSPAELGEALGLAAHTVQSVLAKLFEHDLVVDLSAEPRSRIAADAFHAICGRLFPVWKTRLFSHPLWAALSSGSAPAPLFAGWLLESYHFIEGVNDRIPVAVAECADARIRHVFAQHYAEEYDHWLFFQRSLNALGLPNEQIQATRPLPSTLAVLQHMRHAARRDPLSYALCSGFLESTGADRARGVAFFERLKHHYAAQNPEIVTPMAAHLSLDEEYGHGDLLAEICGGLGPIPVERASAALDDAALLVETLEMWSTDIERTYSRYPVDARTRLHFYRAP